MAKKTSTNKATPLQIVGVQISRRSRTSLAGGRVRPWLNLSVELENRGDAPVHVWSSDRGYTYDFSTHVLSVHLAEVPLNLPQGVSLRSAHYTPPPQIAIAPKSGTTLTLSIPGFVREFVSGKEPGGGWEEEQIGVIDEVAFDLQYGTATVESIRVSESYSEFRERLLAYGTAVHVKIAPTS
jgi:hypothetical protein